MSLEQVQNIIVEQLNLSARPKPTTTLRELAEDSLDRVEILMAIEQHFNFKTTDDEAERLTDVASLAALVQKKNNS